jgi:SPP1 gp7 family putative phage head morphogenesis protein
MFNQFETMVQETMGDMRGGIAARGEEILDLASGSKDIEACFDSITSEDRPWDRIEEQGEMLFGLMMNGAERGWKARRAGGAASTGKKVGPRFREGDMMMGKISGAFDLVPARAADFFRLAAFWVSDVTDENVLADARKALQGALDQGYSWGEVRPMLAEAFGSEMGGRLETIFRTNLFQAYNGGRYWSGQEAREQFPYWQYFTVQDDRVRPSHAALHGKIYRKDDTIWQSIFPPNGFNCRCTVEELDDQDLENDNVGISLGLPSVPETGDLARPDFGWNYNPASWEKVFAGQMKQAGFVERKPEDYGLTPAFAGETIRNPKSEIEKWDMAVSERMRRAEELLKPQEDLATVVDFEGAPRAISMQQARGFLANETKGPYFPLAIDALKMPDEVWGTMETHGEGARPNLWMFKAFETPSGNVTIAMNCVGGEIEDFVMGAGAESKRRGVLVYRR